MKEKMFYLEKLNDELVNIGENLDIICVGGFVLECHGLKSTLDIDAFYNPTKVVKEVIKSIGDQYNINNPSGEVWLNNDVMNLNAAPELSLCEKISDFSNLNVYIAPLDYVMGMKFLSMRNKDVIDIAAIIKYRKYNDPKEVQKRLQALCFEEIDESMMLEAFAEAYGMDWLEKYYTENYF